MNRTRVLLVVAILLLVVFPALAQEGTGGEDVDAPFAGDPRYPAPDFPADVTWLNVAAPLTLNALRGKAVLLDFWTYGCINCIHMIPVLHRLEEKYGDALAVIGVHSAKFENEGQTDNIRQIVRRYGLEHPVINDSGFTVWNAYRRYGVNAWPTFVLIDPRGNLFAVQAGEIPFEAFDRVIGGMIDYFDSLGEINREPIKLAPEAETTPNTALSFPGKVLADTAGGRLFIADSSHNRIVIADLNTFEVLDVIGTGANSLTDGAYDAATFDKPQGMALSGSTLYVADTNNHVIRAVNLVDRSVSTVAGTGKQGYERSVSGPATAIPLSSPWDVELGDNNILYMAMAGTHQIWQMKLDEGTVQSLVGSGIEGLLDGAFADAQLAQPSGLFYRDGVLYFADSESSSIRAADVNSQTVSTLAGSVVNNLFAFGDEDGRVGISRLQHPLAVTGGSDGRLYVADTYNSRIKLLDPQQREIKTLFGLGGAGGFRDGGAAEAQFDEPGGLDYADGRLYVADTNNHAIRVIDLAANTVSTVTFPNPEALQIGGQVTVVGGNAAQGEQITLPEQTVKSGAGEIVLNIVLPEGYKLNALAPFTAEWTASGEAITIDEANRQQRIAAPELPLRVPVTLTEGDDLLHGDLTIYYCEAVRQELCFIDQVGIDVPVSVSPTGTAVEIHIERTVTPPALTAGGLE
ncbi:MAG: redoxin domain-containing protein [Chloroflexi bacterium]|nr:redoxin domain-containing protein [Chloroflexota bacterium]